MIAHFFNKTGSLAAFVLLSLLAHLLGGLMMSWFGPFTLRAPIPLLPAITVALQPDTRPPATKPVAVPVPTADTAAAVAKQPTASPELPSRQDDQPVAAAKAPAEPPAVSEPPLAAADKQAAISPEPPPPVPVHSTVPGWPPAVLKQGPVRSGAEFVPVAREKLTYRIVLLGMPVGTAVMEATNSNGEVRITTKITSNEFTSTFYPVNDFVDTRLIKGNYLLTRIRQHEGSFVGDTGFTLMLRERNAFWVDRLNKRYANHQLPRGDVMDMISGFYYLRNQPLEVGKPVLLQLFDSNEYAPTTVEVLRREHLRLPGFREVDTLVVHPLLKTAGFFRRTGDMLVWLTDDDKKVPVKLETQIPLGSVTAELVAAEADPLPPARQP